MPDEPNIDAFSAQDIDQAIDRILRDLGNPEPPLDLKDARALLKLDLTYYSKTDLNLLDEMSHRVKLAGQSIGTKAQSMWDVVKKVGLKGLILPEQRQIFIDDNVVPLKRRFVIAHEVSHDIIPWHRTLMLGDNDQTLSPTCHETMEAEANYGARRLIFLGDRFSSEWKGFDQFDWKNLQAVKKSFGNTITTTLWQVVLAGDPDFPSLGLVSRHPRHQGFCQRAGTGNVAYFFGCPKFGRQFANLERETIYNEICQYIGFQKRGPLGSSVRTLPDVNGDYWDFMFSTFCNGYDVLTHAQIIGKHRAIVGF